VPVPDAAAADVVVVAVVLTTDTEVEVEVLVTATVVAALEVAGVEPPEQEKTAGPGAVYVVSPMYKS